VVKTFKSTLLDAAKKMKKQEEAAEANSASNSNGNNGSNKSGNDSSSGQGTTGGPSLQQSRSSGSLEDENHNHGPSDLQGRGQRISLGRNPMANGLDHASGSFEDDRWVFMFAYTLLCLRAPVCSNVHASLHEQFTYLATVRREN
jgi:hypothetical protein